MSLRDYIHPGWGDAWQTIKRGFSPEDYEPYDDALGDRVPGQRIEYIEPVRDTEEKKVWDGWCLGGPTAGFPVVGEKYTDEKSRRWQVTRVENYQKREIGGYTKSVRIWAKQVPS